MFRHVVLYKIKEDRKKDIPQLIANFNGMKGQIPGLVDLEAGADILGSERSYDLALITLFESREAYEAYLKHPAHLPVKAYMGGAKESSVSCDFDI